MFHLKSFPADKLPLIPNFKFLGQVVINHSIRIGDPKFKPCLHPISFKSKHSMLVPTYWEGVWAHMWMGALKIE